MRIFKAATWLAPSAGRAVTFFRRWRHGLPFGALEAVWPDSGLIGKLYKIQLTFSRRVVLVADNPGAK